MSWKTAATVLIVVFVIAVMQSALAGPAVQIQESLNGTGDYSKLDGVSGYNGNEVISGLLGSWFDMGLLAMFGVMAWGVARVVRRELTRGGQL